MKFAKKVAKIAAIYYGSAVVAGIIIALVKVFILKDV